LLQSSLWREGEAKSQSASSHEENVRSRHQRLFEENARKNKKDEGLQTLRIRIRELYMHRQGISIPCAHHKGRQPLIECAKHDFQIMYFPFLCFFWVDKGVALAPIYPQVR